MQTNDRALILQLAWDIPTKNVSVQKVCNKRNRKISDMSIQHSLHLPTDQSKGSDISSQRSAINQCWASVCGQRFCHVSHTVGTSHILSGVFRTIKHIELVAVQLSESVCEKRNGSDKSRHTRINHSNIRIF